LTDGEWEKLREYALLCSDSYGGVVELVIDLYERSDYISSELKDMLEKESIWNLNNFINNTEIEIIEETKKISYKELNWI